MNYLAAIAAGASDTPTSSQIFFVAGTLAVALIYAIGAVLVKKFREPTRIEALWERLDLLEEKGRERDAEMQGMRTAVTRAVRRGDAAVGVVRDLVRQWPHGHVPRLNPVDIDELDEEDAIPESWKVKP